MNQSTQYYYPIIDGVEYRQIKDWIDMREAASGELLAYLADSGKVEIDLAVDSAEKAFETWSKTSVEERSRLMFKLADMIEKNAEELSILEAKDTGRYITEMRNDFIFAVEQIRYFASVGLAFEDFGNTLNGGYMIGKRVPYGVVGQIIPWNDPSVMLIYKIAPALITGNTVVIKPDHNACLAVMEIVKMANTIFPKGVINIVPGTGEKAGSALTSNKKITKLAFTGSVPVGKLVGNAGISNIVSSILELGGKSPNIVFPDIENMDAVVEDATSAVLNCNGQSCLAGTRLFIHEDIYDQFIEKLINKFESLKIGDPLNEDTELSGMISNKQANRVMDMIALGKKEGAKLLTGGNRATIQGFSNGNFIEPTIFEVKNSMTIAQEEIFGPVLCVLKWSDYNQMVSDANDTKYGLASGMYTSNLENAMKLADDLQAGCVWINKYFNIAGGFPFGGFKESGIGRELCLDTLKEYTQLKGVSIVGKTI
ncbi:aldehyde dehydrogenase family protein [Lactococcus lactis]|uniref:aldehyde dehydrogenase family protein n=1 Tax=Lactococcus lactis TaxID=1358 RepID=UPI002418A271|nr:aldehyde dehydrogenase family protein [Lactococcus lactis]MDG4967498.1 aldehyde dehydrogenase family protein [Lactococcus lactis]